MNKTCTDCNVEKLEEDFYFASSRKTTRYSRCKKCHNQRRKNWPYSSDKASIADYQRIKYREYKQQIFKILGNKCARCGYNENPLAFDIDHIDNDGVFSRKTTSGKTRKGSNSTDLKRALEHNCEGLQILCGTCHNIKTRSV